MAVSTTHSDTNKLTDDPMICHTDERHLTLPVHNRCRRRDHLSVGVELLCFRQVVGNCDYGPCEAHFGRLRKLHPVAATPEAPAREYLVDRISEPKAPFTGRSAQTAQF